MIQLDDKMLRQLQMIELEMLKEVDRICRGNCINYTIIGGTLLGAVRHGGFIPWDDDADIAMLRPEYEKFRKICQKELDSTKYYFQDFRNTQGYRWGYGKVRRKDTIFLRENQEHMPYEQGVFIDIFPIDAVPDNKILRYIQKIECFCIRKILWSAVGRVSDKSKAMRFIYQILYKIPDSTIWHRYMKMTKFGGQIDSKLVRTLTFPMPHRAFGYKRRWFAETADIEFEGYTFLGVKDYSEWLSFEFGDYMKLPPDGTRKCHPVTSIYLTKD